MAIKKSDYGNESITALKGAQRVRKRPAVIFGSDGVEGCEHSIFEILSNSIDEAREGFGDVIKVTIFEDHCVEIEDNGRGIPVDFNSKEGKFNWELIFCELYAGGKYDNLSSGSYEYSLGLNGLGLCSTQYSSEFMDVTILRDGFEYTLHFEKGENVGGLSKKPSDKKFTGSKIKWKPDLDVFTDIAVPIENIRLTIKRQAIVNAGITFILNVQKNNDFVNEVFFYENGISDYVKEIVNDDVLTPIQTFSAEKLVKDRDDKPEYKTKINVSMTFSNLHSLSEYYHNSSFLEHGGAPLKAVKAAFVSQIDKYLKQNKKYIKGENKILFNDIEDCLVIIISSFSGVTSYENQTKKAITNKGIQEAITDLLKKQLEVFFIENPLDAEKVAKQILINKRSRENAEKTRKSLKKKLTVSMDMSNRVAKFVDCRQKDSKLRELFIVEGDSALGACKQARDPDFQAVIPIRGKILNCLKADYNKIFKNEIITDLIKVMGCGVDIKSKYSDDFSSFDINNLRFNKIILCTDADVDGFQIRTLLLTMIYRITPKLIDQGKVFIAESPLYEITTKDKTYFAYNESEKQKFLKQIGKQKYTIQRSKGLGENEPDMMSLTTMNPKTRRLIKVMPTDFEQTMLKFDLLLGDNLSGRKQYISQNGHLYMNDLDLS
ncbi:MAG: toprim domain-containing protein [Clostridia bacterium]|nr:toprim domain-containing protein [Clostridia bacterium]